MRITVSQTSKQNGDRAATIKLAVELAWFKGMPVDLEGVDDFGYFVSVQVMPWATVDEIDKKFAKRATA